MLELFTKTKTILAPVSGKVIRDVSEGRGIAIVPTDTRVYAPISGIVAVKEGAACDMELTADLGRNVIKLCGKGFTSHIKSGSRVAAGDIIASIDYDFVRSGGYYTYLTFFISPALKGCVTGNWVSGGESTITEFY